MPVRSKRPCSVPGCPRLTDERWCEEHTKNKNVARPYDLNRGNSAERGYDNDWRKLRIVALKRDHYLCQRCLKEDKLVAATDVDHIVPLADGGERLDLDNLCSLCKACHSRKTAMEDGGLGRKKKARLAVHCSV